MAGCLDFSPKPRDTTREQGAPRGSTMNLPANSVIDSLLMDIGFKEKNDVYDRDLEQRQRASRKGLEEFTAQQKTNEKDDRPASIITTAPRVDTAANTAADTVLPETAETALTDVEAISEETFGGDDASSTESVGAAEDEAIDYMDKGRRSTILTKPSGLLGDGEEDEKTRKRRSLIG